jgi:hypothetical protein
MCLLNGFLKATNDMTNKIEGYLGNICNGPYSSIIFVFQGLEENTQNFMVSFDRNTI